MVKLLGTLVVRIDDELEKEFRKYAFIMFGQRKGSLSRAAEEAIRLWLSNIKRDRVVGFDNLEIDVPPSRRDIVGRILEECDSAEREKLRRLLEAIGVIG